MTDFDRRTAALIALLGPFATGVAAGQKPAFPTAVPEAGGQDNEIIALLIYPGMTLMDLIGPQTMFATLMGAKLLLVAKTMEPVTGDSDVSVIPHVTFETCPRDLTVLFVPGGTTGTIAAAKDPATITFVADRGARAKYVTSVCSGSLILGRAGLLKGYKATSHWSCRDALAGFGAIPTDSRVVRDRNRITGAGVTSGLDFVLTMVAALRDRNYAECAQLVTE